MAKILIADSDIGCAKALTRLIEKNHSVFLSHDGDSAWELLQAQKPDLLVLDPELPGIDGITLLHRMTDESMKVSVLVMSRFFSAHMIAVLDRLKVDVLLRKPCDLANAAAHVEEILQYKLPATDIPQVLSLVGIPANVKGCHYLRDAVRLMREDPDLFMTKELYPTIGRKYGVNGERVERCIRNAIGLAWKKRDIQLWRNLFEKGCKVDVKKPPNKVFIARMVSLCERQVG